MSAVLEHGYAVDATDRATIASAFDWCSHSIDIRMGRAPGLSEWQALASVARGSPFQEPDFTAAWMAHAASPYREAPLFVTGSVDGELRFVLPMAVARLLGARVLSWLATPHANYGMPLAAPGVLADKTPAQIGALLQGVAMRCDADVLFLDNQPLSWNGAPNPFAALPGSLQNANDTFVLDLDDDYSSQHRRLFSGATRSGLNRKLKRFRDEYDLAFESVRSQTERVALHRWFVRQKTERLAEQGSSNVFELPAIHALWSAMIGNPDGVDLDVLKADGQVIALAITMRSGPVACLLNTAFLGDEFKRFSPGALLLQWVVAQMHERGVKVFDFGPGDIAYKREWDPNVIPMSTTIQSLSAKGLPAAAVLTLRTRAKALIKRDKRLFEPFLKARRLYRSTLLRARPPAAPSP